MCLVLSHLVVSDSLQESWSGLPCSPPGDLPDPGLKPMSLMSHALTDRFFLPPAPTGKLTFFFAKKGHNNDTIDTLEMRQ